MISGYDRASDWIEVSAAGLGGGLVAGGPAPFTANTTGLSGTPAGTGQFVWETDALVLWWDADGSGGHEAIRIASFTGISGGASGFNASELVIIA